jgi:triacylglycerol lipase
MSFLVRLPTELYSRSAFDGFAGTGFSIGTARAMAWLSQLAYEDEPGKIDSILQLWGARRIVSFHHLLAIPLPVVSTRGFIAERLGDVFVAFEGTDPFITANWVTNFNFVADQDGIHQGFNAALDACWPDIRDTISRTGSDMRLFVVGHSLGAALATLSAVRAKLELGRSAEGVYTFGMPRVGTPEFARAYNQILGERTYRLVHGEDIVPAVPPSELDFMHVGRLLACAPGAKFDPALLSRGFSDDPPFVESQLSSLKTGLRNLLSGVLPLVPRPDPLGQLSGLLPPGIADHLPDRYWGALESFP